MNTIESSWRASAHQRSLLFNSCCSGTLAVWREPYSLCCLVHPSIHTVHSHDDIPWYHFVLARSVHCIFIIRSKVSRLILLWEVYALYRKKPTSLLLGLPLLAPWIIGTYLNWVWVVNRRHSFDGLCNVSFYGVSAILILSFRCSSRSSTLKNLTQHPKYLAFASLSLMFYFACPHIWREMLDKVRYQWSD